MARSLETFLPDRAIALIKENLPLVCRMDYEPQPILLNIESSLEYNIRLHSCAKEPDTVKWIEEYVRAGDVLFDIGANVGAYSLVAAKATRGKATVYAFEPAFPNFAQLCQNIFLNDCGRSIIPLPIALSDHTTLDQLNYNNLTAGGALHAFGKAIDFKDHPFEPVFQHRVLSYRLDDFLSQFRIAPPNHLKIDVDGIELAILRGGSDTLSNPSVKSILVEVDEGLPAVTEILDFLTGKGFELKDKQKYVYGDRYEHLSTIFNYLFVH